MMILSVAMLFSGTAFAQDKDDAGGESGERFLHCIFLPRVKDSDIIDNQTVLFAMQGGAHVRMKLEYECYSLKFDDSYYYRVSNSRLCTTDVITTRSGFSCPIKSFEVLEGEDEHVQEDALP